MAKAPKNSNHQKKILVVLFIEGDTEVEFYKKTYRPPKISSWRKFILWGKSANVKGVGNFQSKVNRIFEKRIKPKYDAKAYEYQVFLSYDTDVFEFTRKPLVDWKSVRGQLLSLGAHEMYEIEAKSSIEDWFLFDLMAFALFWKFHKVSIFQEIMIRRIAETFFKGK